MSLDALQSSQMYSRKSNNLAKLGFDFTEDPFIEYLKVQKRLITDYHINGGSMLTIMKDSGIPSSKSMDTIFKLFDVDTRSPSDAAKTSILEGRSDPHSDRRFKVTYHTAWDGSQHRLRSSLELEYAKQLDEQKIRYEVESMRIRYFDAESNLYRVAIPDFYLPDDHRIVEVKSTYWLKPENMSSKVEAYKQLGFNFSLFLDGTLIEEWRVTWGSNPDPCA